MPYNLDQNWIIELIYGKESQFTLKELEAAWWHLWTLNTYHITMSFDANMVILLDWALVFHMGVKE